MKLPSVSGSNLLERHPFQFGHFLCHFPSPAWVPRAAPDRDRCVCFKEDEVSRDFGGYRLRPLFMKNRGTN